MLGTQCKAVASIYYKCKGSLTPHWPVFSSRLYNLHATMDDLNRRSRQMSKRRNRRLSRRSQRILHSQVQMFVVVHCIGAVQYIKALRVSPVAVTCLFKPPVFIWSFCKLWAFLGGLTCFTLLNSVLISQHIYVGYDQDDISNSNHDICSLPVSLPICQFIAWKKT